MSILDDALTQVLGTGDLAALAGKVGLTAPQVESAIAGLGRAMPEPGDTAALAASKTGLPLEPVQKLLAELGGEQALGRITSVLDQGGLAGLASGLFER